MIVVVMMLVLVVIVVMIVVVMMLMLVIIVVVMIVMVMMLVLVIVIVVMMLFLDFLHHLLREGMAFLHRREHLCASQLVPRRGEDARLVVVLAQQRHRRLELFSRYVLGAAEDDRARMLDLIEEEFTEILDVHLALGHVRDGHKAVELYLDLPGHALDRVNHVGELAHAGGLDEDAVWMILFDHLAQRLAKIAHQRAADAAGVHLGNLNARFLEETAVDADFAEFVFDQNNLFILEGFAEQLFDERRLARAQKAGNNINLGHMICLLIENRFIIS